MDRKMFIKTRRPLLLLEPWKKKKCHHHLHLLLNKSWQCQSFSSPALWVLVIDASDPINPSHPTVAECPAVQDATAARVTVVAAVAVATVEAVAIVIISSSMAIQ